MDREEVIRMAREVDLYDGRASIYEDELILFAALVAAAERERCAKVCDALLEKYGEYDANAEACANDIRALP